MKRIAEAHLTDSAWDQKEAESLLPSAREVHPSRKHSQERRAPRKSQQKTRMKVRDEDISKSDTHLSLSSDFWGSFEWPRTSRLSAGIESVQSKSLILTKLIYECHVGSEYIDQLSNGFLSAGGPILNDPQGTSDSPDNTWDKTNIEACIFIIKRSRDFDWKLNLVTKADDFKVIFAEVWDDVSSATAYFDDVTKKLDPTTSTITINPAGRTNYNTKKPELIKLCHRIGVAGWIYNYVHKHTNALINGLEKGDITEELMKIGRDPEEKLTKSLSFSNFLLKHVHGKILNNEIKPGVPFNEATISDAQETIEKALQAFISIANTITAVNAFTDSLHAIADDPDLAAAEEPEDELGEQFEDNTKALEGILSKLQYGDNSNKEDLKPFVPRTEVFNKLADKLEEQLRNNDGWAAIDTGGTESLKQQKEDIGKRIEKIRRFASSRLQISNELVKTRMNKVSAYNGVLHQGHPSGPTNTHWQSMDKRYLNKSHFDSIISSAKEYLKSSWFKSGWDDGAEDARSRAALDLAITMADNGIYQSKIDSNEYNRLLVKLSGEGISVFEDTLIPDSSTIRKASTRSSGSVLSASDMALLKRADLRLGHTTAFSNSDFSSSWKNLMDSYTTLGNGRIASQIDSAEVHPYTLLLAAESLKDRDSGISEKLINMAATFSIRQQLASRLAERSAKETNMADVRVAVDLNTLVRVAYNNPAAREELLPIIAKATGKKLRKPVSSKRKDEDAEAPKKASKKSSAKKSSGHKEIGVAPKKLTSSKGKRVKRSSRKASIDFSSDDLKW